MGFLLSTSVSSKAALGDNMGLFEADLRKSLHFHNPSGVYRERIQWGYTLGRKPA